MNSSMTFLTLLPPPRILVLKAQPRCSLSLGHELISYNWEVSRDGDVCIWQHILVVTAVPDPKRACTRQEEEEMWVNESLVCRCRQTGHLLVQG